MTITINTDFEMGLEKEAYLEFLKQLLQEPMDSTNQQCIAGAYAWGKVCEEVLGTPLRLRNRLAMCLTKACLDSKNPVPAATGTGKI